MAGDSYDYDVVIVGGGSAGLTAARTARGLGARVALVDKERLGGECLWSGCVPSKSLIASAHAAHQTRRLGEFGLAGALNPVDLGAVMDRVRGVVDAVDAGENAGVMRRLGIDVALGHAAFSSPHVLTIDGRPLRGRAFLICTGSRAAVPPIDGLDRVDYLTNETLFGLRALPRRLIVAGGGPNGVETAQAFRYLGSEVTVIAGEGGLLPREDGDASAALTDAFARDGITVVRGRLVAVRPDGAGLCVRYSGGAGGARTAGGAGGSEAFGDRLFLALGRAPNVEGLNLARAGVVHDPIRGIPTDALLRTNVLHIFACGDVSGPYHYTHAAGFQTSAAVRTALLAPLTAKPKTEPMAWTTFTDPEIAHVGQTEEEARRARGSRGTLTLRASFAHVDRALADGTPEGFVKLVVTPWRGRILGGHIVGPRAGELIQEVTLAMSKGLDVTALAGTIHVYPTLGMAVQEAALGFYQESPRYRLLRRPLTFLARHDIHGL